MIKKYKKIIDKADVVSFDIFDTLLTRKLSKPSDVFQYVETQYNREYNDDVVLDFRNKRILAEAECRNENSEEITFEQIYLKLKNVYVDSAQALAQLELKVEMEVATPLEQYVEIYNYAVSQKKKVVLISDMYLPQNFIEGLLVKCNICGYTNLYVSSECGYKKADGKLFSYVKAKESITGNWVHFGDNLKSDFLMARLKGIKSYAIKKIKRDSDLYICSSDPFRRFGYNVLGPLFYGYIVWLHDELVKKNIKKVFFFSREGFFLKRIYDCIYGCDEIESNYLIVSRKSLLLPILSEKKIFDRLELFRKIGNKTAGEYLLSLGISENEKEKFLISNSLNEKDSPKKILEKKKALKDILEQSNEKKYVIQYLADNKVNGKFAIVDIGWTGTMQIALDEILNYAKVQHEMYGFFIGQRPEMVQFIDFNINNEGYLCSYNDRKKNQNKLLSGNCLLELFCMAPHGTCIGYGEDKTGKIVPLLQENEYKEQYHIIKMIQDAVCEYVMDKKVYSNAEGKLYKDYFKRFAEFLENPSLEYAELFGEMQFYDSSLRNIAKKQTSTNPIKFVKEYYNSYWKIGFLKRNLRFRIPYLKVYLITRYIGNLVRFVK